MTPLYRFGNRVFLRLEVGVIFSSLVLFALPLTSCTIFETRPVQEMSDTAAAIKAAHEVQADTQAPELYRQANEWMIRAKNEYRLKNFALARDYSAKARRFAEQAEFESLKLGAARSDVSGFNENPAPPAPTEPYPYPTPTGTPADVYEQRAGQGQPTTPSESPVQPPGPKTTP